MNIYKEIMALRPPAAENSTGTIKEAQNENITSFIWNSALKEAAALAARRECDFIEQECLMADRIENLESHYAYSVQAHAKLLSERTKHTQYIPNNLKEPVAWMIQSVDRQGKAYTDISPVKPSDGMMAQIFRDFKETTLTPLYTDVTIPDGFMLVPSEPTEEQWGGLARDIVMWWSFNRPTGAALFKHLSSLGRDIPEWLHQEIKDVDHVPPKGTVAAIIYKAMLDDSKK